MMIHPRIRCLVLVVLLLGAVTCVWADSSGPDLDTWAELQVDDALKGGLDVEDFPLIDAAFRYRQDFSDWSLSERLPAQLMASPKIDPLIETELLRWEARIAAEEGHPDEAKELFDRMGGLHQWWALGPDTIEELESFDRVASLPPADAEWRFVPGTSPGGWLRLEAMAWPARRQMLYLGCTLRSDRKRPVAIRLGLAQVGRLWLNGEALLSSDYPLMAGSDQISVGARLRKGLNEIVVAVASEDSDWWLRVRLSRPDGSALEGVNQVDQAPSGIRYPASGGEIKIRSLQSELEYSVSRGVTGADVALAAVLVDRSARPRDSGEARDACLRARPSNPIIVGLQELRLNLKPSEERDRLDAIIASGAPAIPSHVRLARWLADRGFALEAHLALAPSDEEPAVHIADLDLDADRWGPISLSGMLELAANSPRCLRVLVTTASRALHFGSIADARRLVAAAEKLAPMRQKVLGLTWDLASRCGNGSKIRESLNSILSADPNRLEIRIRLSRLLSSDDEAAKARSLLAEGLRRCPDNPDIMLESAHLDHRFGKDTQAAATARRVLELRPQNLQAQRLLKLLGDTSHEEIWRTPLEKLSAESKAAGQIGSPAVLLLDHQEVRFLPGNLSEERVQRVFRIGDAKHADAFKTFSIPYVPERQHLRILSARLIRKTGSETNARRSDTPRLADPAVNMYYDTRLKLLSFKDFEDGDIVELAWVLSETAEANETGAYEGGILRLGSAAPTLKAEVELAGPRELLPTWELGNLEGKPEESLDDEGWTHLRWSFEELPALNRDVPPGPSLWTRPCLSYSNHPEWASLATWYAQHVAPRIRPTNRVAEKARELTSGVRNRREKIARIYGFVTTQVHYVGLEFGEHRFRPFSADWVLTHEMGDCKDTAGLLVSLLTSIGIPARMAMVRTADQGPVPTKLAVLEDFNHAIAYLPEDNLWLDGTASGNVVYPPPGADQNAWAMVVEKEGAEPQTTPVVGAGRYLTTYELKQNDLNSVEVNLRMEATGEAGTIQRARFGGSENPTLFSRWFQSQFPGIEMVSDPETQLKPGHDPAVISLKGQVPESLVFAEGALQRFPAGFSLDERFAPGESREGPLLLPVRPDFEWHLGILAGGRQVDFGPPVELKTAFGSLRLETKQIDGGVELHGFFHLKPGMVSAKDYPALRAFLVKVRSLLEGSVEVSS